MATLDNRLGNLEEQLGSKAQSGTELLLNALREIGFDDLCIMLAARDEREGRAPEPFWMLMSYMGDSQTPFEYERYRGLVPDEVIRRAYNHRRNWASAKTVIVKVRQLAGVIDTDGNIMPGYVLADNGCILDAPQGTV